MSDDDFFENLSVEDILAEPKKPAKKKVDGKAKGNRTELGLCKLLTDHFGEEFSRALGSGNRWSQVKHMPEHAKQTLCGDICVPEKFAWVFECKGGYEKEVVLTNVMDGNGIPKLDEFIQQVSNDSVKSGRRPILMWKRNRKPWLCVLKQTDLKPLKATSFEYRIHYRDWVVLPLEGLLAATEKGFWFND